MTPYRLVPLVSFLFVLSVQAFTSSRLSSTISQFHFPTPSSSSSTTVTPVSFTGVDRRHNHHSRNYNQRHGRRTSNIVLEATASRSTLFGREQQQRQQGSIKEMTSTASNHQKQTTSIDGMSKFAAFVTKVGMIAFIVSMCLALPLALLPPALAHRLGFISRVRKEQLALSSGQYCARWLLRFIPFCHVSTKIVRFSDDQRGNSDTHKNRSTRRQKEDEKDEPQPSIWVCNHTSALDVFILLAKDLELRGKGKRPIKVVYVSEHNPCSKEWMRAPVAKLLRRLYV
jgi:hypothetical protein